MGLISDHFVRALLGYKQSHARHGPCLFWYPCSLHAGWCVYTGTVPDPRLQELLDELELLEGELKAKRPSMVDMESAQPAPAAATPTAVATAAETDGPAPKKRARGSTSTLRPSVPAAATATATATAGLEAEKPAPKRAAITVAIVNADGTPALHECSTCGKKAVADLFSPAQLRNKGPGKQRCLKCVKKLSKTEGNVAQGKGKPKTQKRPAATATAGHRGQRQELQSRQETEKTEKTEKTEETEWQEPEPEVNAPVSQASFYAQTTAWGGW